ncbi:hypothetical protein MJO29_000106 [Puccinia striiformis f. sp. tritici]|nr:hypothetical protein MJO29_000106 [Puccinia striiformis f. sp. tritici]
MIAVSTFLNFSCFPNLLVSVPSALKCHVLPSTGHYFLFALKSASPTSVYVALIAAILSLVKHCSDSTTMWFLKSQQDLLCLVLRRSTTLSDPLAYHKSSLIQEIPHSIDTIIQWLKLDPVLTSMTLGDSRPPPPPKKKELDNTLPDPTASELTVCGINQVPIQKYGFQSLQDWVAQLLSHPHIEEALEQMVTQSRIPYNPANAVEDIHDSHAWKQFLGPDRKQFTTSIQVPPINAFGNCQAGKHASTTFLILICLTLPVEFRFRPKNIFQLNPLWNPGLCLSRTHKHSGGCDIFGALLTFLVDLPAVCPALGFSSTSSTHMCLYCLLTKDKITNFDSQSGPRRDTPNHQEWTCKSRDVASMKEKEEIFENHCVRYSALLELQHWDIVSFHCVNSMHNLLLGLLNWHCRRLWAMEDVLNAPEPEGVSNCKLVDLLMDTTPPQPHPTDLEPNSVENAQNLSLVHNFAQLVSLVKLGLMREMDSATISQYHHHLLSYLESSVKMFGPLIAPNHHMAIHLAECLKRFGLVQSWWTFPL